MTDHKRICFIFNPSANGGKAGTQEKQIRSAVKRIWPAATWLNSRPEDHFWSSLEEKAGTYDLYVACGGDGTVHKTGNIAANSGSSLGVIPLGSGNDFAVMNGIPESVDSALKILRNGQYRNVDLIRCSGDINCWCLNTAGLGLDGLANQYTQALKKKIGSAGYLFGAIKAVLKSKPHVLRIQSDNSESYTEKKLLMLTACIGFREGGRFIIAPQARNDDGRMEILMVHPMGKLSLLIALVRFTVRFPKGLKGVEQYESKKLIISCDIPLTIHIDGEYSGLKVKNITLDVYREFLRVISNPR